MIAEAQIICIQFHSVSFSARVSLPLNGEGVQMMEEQVGVWGKERYFDHLLDPRCSEILWFLFPIMRHELDLEKAVRKELEKYEANPDHVSQLLNFEDNINLLSAICPKQL